LVVEKLETKIENETAPYGEVIQPCPVGGVQSNLKMIEKERITVTFF
jgi:hypothetical protein